MKLSQSTKMQIRIIAIMYLSYGAIMLCRQMITILGPAMLADQTLGLTKTHLGDFAAYGTLGALFGKIIWGPLTDKVGGRKTFLLGLTTTALLLIGFGLSPNVLSFTIFSFLIYCLKSSGWPGLAKLIENWFHPNHYGRTWSILSTSSRASVVAGTFFFGWLLSVMQWKFVAISAAIFSLAVVVLCYFFMQSSPKDPQFIEIGISDSDNDASKQALDNLRNHPLKETTLNQGLIAFAKSHRVWLAVTMMMMLTCAMAFLDFISIYLMEVYQLTPSKAAMASSVFPLGSLSGLIASVAFYDRFSKKSLSKILSTALLISTTSVIILKFMPELGLNESMNFNIALICIFLFGLSISPAYYIPLSVFSIEYGGPHSGTLICLLDAFGFGASAAMGFIGGRLADSSGGWDSFMTMILIVSIIATLSVWAFMHGEFKASK